MKRMLCEGAGPEEIERVIRDVIMQKPEKHTLDTKAGGLMMNRVGG